MPEEIKAVAEQADAEQVTNAAEVETEKVDAADSEQEHDEQEPKGKRKGGWQRKIAKLERELEVWRDMALEPSKAAPERQEAQATTTQEQPPIKPQRPKEEDFNDWKLYNQALIKYESDRDDYFDKLTEYKARRIAAEERQKLEQTSRQQKVAEGFAAQVAEAKQKYDDFEEVAFNVAVPLTQPMMDAITDSPMGAEIAYELGSNPDEAERIARMAPVAAIRAIGVIEARLAKQEAAEEETEDKEPPPQQSKAPKPPTPVRKTTGVNTEPRDDEPYKDWLRKREAQLKRN